MRTGLRLPVLGALLAALALFASLATAAPQAAGDGTLAVSDGRGRFVLDLSGSVIGRIDRGKLVIRNPFAVRGAGPIVRGHDWIRVRGTTVTYGGKGIRFRILGGRFKARIQSAVGVDLSIVGRGRATLQGVGLTELGLSNGEYSLNGGESMPIPDELLLLEVRAPEPPKPMRSR